MIFSACFEIFFLRCFTLKMSGILSNFVSRVFNFFKKKEEEESSRDLFTTPLRRCNSVIEERRIKDSITSRTHMWTSPDSNCDVWATPSNSNWRLQSSDDEDSGVFHTPRTEKRDFLRKECPSCKGDMGDLHHQLAFCQEDIPVRGRVPDRTENRPRRSRSFDSREALFVNSRNTEWHERFNSLRTDSGDALTTSIIPLHKEKSKARRHRSVHSMVNSSGNQRIQKLKRSRSQIPVPNRYIPPTHQTICPEGILTKLQIAAHQQMAPHVGSHLQFKYHQQRARDFDSELQFVSHQQRAPHVGSQFQFASHQQRARNVAHLSRVNAAFDSLFGHYCNKKYRGNIIDGLRHCKWMREAGVHMDEDGNGFRKCAKGKLDLNITEYKCAIKKMCDEAGSDYWDVLEKMTSCDRAESTSTKSGSIRSETNLKIIN